MKKCTCLISIILLMNIFVNASDSYMQKLKSGILAVNSENFTEAENIFSGLIEQEPSRPEAYCGMAIINISTGEFETAKKYILLSIEKNSEYSQSCYLSGIVEEQLQNYNSALESYRRYLRLEPDSKKKEKILKRIDYLKEKLRI